MVRSAINKVKTPGDAVAKDEEKEAILPTILFTSVQLSAVLEPCMCRRNPVCVAIRTLYVSPQFTLRLWTSSCPRGCIGRPPCVSASSHWGSNNHDRRGTPRWRNTAGFRTVSSSAPPAQWTMMIER